MRLHSANELLDAAVRVASRDGLSMVTFGRVAKEAGTNDRTVVYYFADKTTLLAAVVGQAITELQHLLIEAFANAPLPPASLAAAAWPVVASPRGDRLFALFFELAGLAAAGRQPFSELAQGTTEALLAWIADLVDAPDPIAAAHALVAQLDGALLLRHLAGADAGEKAAIAFGWR